MNSRALLYVLLLMGIAAPAAAQQTAPPASGLPTQAFPALPQSRSCAPRDIIGIWKLIRVYEIPAGVETTEFMASPVQYVNFNPNSLFSKYNAGATEVPPDMVREAFNKPPAVVQQFVVNSGFVFFYQDSKAIDTQACFIVVNPQNEFLAGEMLLMPPEGTIQGRLMKIYVSVNEQPKPAPRKGRRR